MKKSIFLATWMLLFSSAIVTAQVTIGSNDDPKATLDVVAADPTDANAVEGVIAPRLTGDQIKGKDARYGTDQTGAIVYATAAASPTTAKTVNITAPGYYYFDGLVWQAFKGEGGGATSGQDIRGKVKVLTQATYTVEADVYAIISNHSTGINITFPDLTAEDAGRVIFYYNNNTVTLANTLTNVTGQIGVNQARGGTIMWTGTQWFFIGK